MYRPAFHRLDDREAMLRLIAFHCPFLLDRASGPHGALRGHFAQDEVEAHAVPTGTPALVIFRGPEAYITPGWYPGVAAHGRVVPTWNYAVVHAHGAVRWSADRSTLEIPIHRLEGKLKASQDEDRADREGTVKGLNALGTDAARTMAALVRQALDDSPH